MTKKPKTYETVEEYDNAANKFYIVSTMTLLSFAKNECNTKDTIIRNFLARSARSLKSIFSLYKLADYQNAWIVYRALLDRLFHLNSIGKKDEFLKFDDWSIFEQYKAQNKVKSDKIFKHEAVGCAYELSDDKKSRIKKLSKNNPTWKRPKAENIAKEMKMEFLYKYGYDFASMHVHPMSNDGEEDFFSITKFKFAPKFPLQITVLGNSLLVSTLILKEALNLSSFSWHKLLYTYINQVISFLDKGDISYKKTFIELARLYNNNDVLCKFQ
ncbi:MAG: hypothetical protein GQ534_10100 [Candidatus Delongbacteria bacterium]|nr:hypothetical protein [Candidatus Delongbacteria bacterium]